ncbi:MAG: Fe2+ or Zn2+ uptake regulation protein, partial [Oleiphilaceae bacterium]
MKDKKITEEYLANTVNHIVDREGKEPTANALLEIFKEEGFSTSWRWIDKTLAKLNTAGLIKTHKGSSTSVMRVTLHDALDKVVDDAIDF